MYSVIESKGNKGRTLSWLRMVTNRRMILIKSAATRMSNHMLSYRKSKLECWEALLVVRIEHLRVTDQCRSSGRNLEWDTLMIFCDKPLV